MRSTVPTPYTVHVHPYPTRFHGGIWTRPVFGLPYVHHNQTVLRPVMWPGAHGRPGERMLSGLGADAPASPASPASTPVVRNNGMFRTYGEGGGIFNQALAGDGATTTLLIFAAGAAIGALALLYGPKLLKPNRKRRRRVRTNGRDSVGKFVSLVRRARESGLSLKDAVREVVSRHPGLRTEVLEEIGSWPSSEPELRALQMLPNVRRKRRKR